jgi:hypothetical protein
VTTAAGTRIGADVTDRRCSCPIDIAARRYGGRNGPNWPLAGGELGSPYPLAFNGVFFERGTIGCSNQALRW